MISRLARGALAPGLAPSFPQLPQVVHHDLAFRVVGRFERVVALRALQDELSVLELLYVLHVGEGYLFLLADWPLRSSRQRAICVGRTAGAVAACMPAWAHESLCMGSPVQEAAGQSDAAYLICCDLLIRHSLCRCKHPARLPQHHLPCAELEVALLRVAYKQGRRRPWMGESITVCDA